MPPKKSGQRNTVRQTQRAKPLAEVYLDTCREHDVKPNSNFLASLPDKQGNTMSTDVIDLSRNYVGDRGVIPLMATIQRCPNVTHLVLSENGLRNRGVSAVCSALARHTGIVALDISRNCVSQGAAAALEQLLTENPHVVEINVDDTKIDIDWRAKLKHMAAANGTL